MQQPHRRAAVGAASMAPRRASPAGLARGGQVPPSQWSDEEVHAEQQALAVLLKTLEGEEHAVLETEQRDMVADVQSAIAAGHCVLRESLSHPDGSVSRRYGISPPEYLAEAVKDGVAAGMGQESSHLYEAMVHMRDGRALRIDVEPSFEVPFTVLFGPVPGILTHAHAGANIKYGEASSGSQVGSDAAASSNGPPAPSTVQRLAAEFSQAELIGAVIQRHNPQDFTGASLPSGASVGSQALSSEPAASGVTGNAALVQAIAAAVPKGSLNKTQHYKAILDANERRPAGDPWPNKSMIKAAGIDSGQASRIRDRLAPDTPRTIAAREFIADTAPKDDQKDPASERYRRLLEHNKQRASGEPWPDKSMIKAAGIDSSQAIWIRERQEPDTPRTIAARQFIADTAPKDDQKDPASERYRRLLEHNKQRASGEPWPDDSMIKAAGIDQGSASRIRDRLAPDTPRTTAVRQFIADTAPKDGKKDPATARYRRVLEHNKQRASGEPWPPKSMEKAAEIDSSDARKIRKRLAAEDGQATESVGSDSSDQESL
ncbi:hypothetical protein [Bordetella muralis]|uniref:hypothetical protein n=1 Tax=Bordetella muralis TaxID=1649130 RepID=UPI0039F140B2